MLKHIGVEEQSYHGTSSDVSGSPLPAFQEPFIFPKYVTDDTREKSLLQLVPEIVETIVMQIGEGVSPKEAFTLAVADMGADEFNEVKRKILQGLSETMQTDICGLALLLRR